MPPRSGSQGPAAALSPHGDDDAVTKEARGTPRPSAAGEAQRKATSAADCRSRPGARGGSRVMPRQLQTAGLSGSRVRHPPLRQTLREGIAKVTGAQQRDEHHTQEREDYCVQRLNDPDWRRAHVSHKVPVWMSLLVVLGHRWCVAPGQVGVTFYTLKRGTTVHSRCEAESALGSLDSLLNALGLENKEYHPNAADLARFCQQALVACNLVEVCGERLAEKLKTGDFGQYTAFEGGILSHPNSDTWTYSPWGTTILPLVTRVLPFAFPFADYGTLQRVSTTGAEGILVCTRPLRPDAPPLKLESLVEQRRTNPTWAKLKEFAPEDASVLLVFLANVILGLCAKLKVGLMLLGDINTGKSTYTAIVKSGLGCQDGKDGGKDGGFCCPCVHVAPPALSAAALTAPRREIGRSADNRYNILNSVRLAWTLYRLQTVQEWPERQSIAVFNTVLGGQEDLVAVKTSQPGAQASNRTVTAAFIAQANAVASVAHASGAVAEKVYCVEFRHNQLGKAREGFPTPEDVWRLVVTAWAAGACEAPLRWLRDEHPRPPTLKELASVTSANDEGAVLAAFLGRYDVVPADQPQEGQGVETVELGGFLSSLGSDMAAGRLSLLLGAKLRSRYKSRSTNTSRHGVQFRKYFVACRRVAAPQAAVAVHPAAGKDDAASPMDASAWALSRTGSQLKLVSQHVLAAADDVPSCAQYKAIRCLNRAYIGHRKDAGLEYLTDSDWESEESLEESEESRKRMRASLADRSQAAQE